MLDKVTSFSITSTAVLETDIKYSPDSGMMKIASASGDTSGIATTYNLTEVYDPEFLYVSVRGISAGEYFGPNKNSDWFSEMELVGNHHTFLDAHVFANHDNKDVAKAIGQVLKSTWDDKSKSVELLIKIDRKLAPTIARGFEKGYSTDVSMGCRVAYTVCSICGNKAKTRPEFCDHVRTQRNQILADGKKVFEYNIGPKFHDISVVLNGADRTAKVLEIYDEMSKTALLQDLGQSLKKTAATAQTMEKVASLPENEHSVINFAAANVVDYSPPTSVHKTADIDKVINTTLHAHGAAQVFGDDETVGPELDNLVKAAGTDMEVALFKNANVLKTVRDATVGTVGLGLTSNYLQGKRLRGEDMSKTENFVADNPGLLPLAFLTVGVPGLVGLRKRLKLLKKAGDQFLSSEDNYTALMTKNALESIPDPLVDIVSSLDKYYSWPREKTAGIKEALYHQLNNDFDLVNKAKSRYHITDTDINSYVKNALSAVINDMEKTAGLGRSILEAQLVNSGATRGLQTGLAGPVVVGSILDGFLYNKFFNSASKDHMEDAKIRQQVNNPDVDITDTKI